MNEAISLARQTEGTITGIYVLPGLPSEFTSTLTSYSTKFVYILVQYNIVIIINHAVSASDTHQLILQ
jgi:hypothetical protein